MATMSPDRRKCFPEIALCSTFAAQVVRSYFLPKFSTTERFPEQVKHPHPPAPRARGSTLLHGHRLWKRWGVKLKGGAETRNLDSRNLAWPLGVRLASLPDQGPLGENKL